MLDEHLSYCMAERHGMGREGSHKKLHAAVKDNPSLLEQAKIRLNYFESPAGKSVLARDHVSRIHNLILEELVAAHV